MESLSNLLNILSSIAVIIGIPLGLYEIFKSSKKERTEKEENVYHALDEKYLDYLRLCLQYSHLDIFDIPDNTLPVLTEQQKKEEVICFTLLLSIFERAYVMHRKKDTTILQGQWEGWNEYIHTYCKRENFRHAWEISGNTFDPRFQTFMSESIKMYSRT